ncbi:MAG: GNAT family N-acetyltransferase [Defluviitaleaceae bacterium]|nr:GNAT family N-acetyltransferase [Defluviitaleaceae bacterium]
MNYIIRKEETPKVFLCREETPKVFLCKEETPKVFLCKEETPKVFLCKEETPKVFLCREETPQEILCSDGAVALAEISRRDLRMIYDSWLEDETVLSYNYRLPYTFKEFCANHMAAQKKPCGVSFFDTWSAVILLFEDKKQRGVKLENKKQRRVKREKENPQGFFCKKAKIVGRIGISPGMPDLTITVFAPYRNKKIGTAAFALGVRYCFETLGMDAVYAGCYEDNTASRKMIERCGFTPNPEGNVKEKHIITGEDRLQLDYCIRAQKFQRSSFLNPKFLTDYELVDNGLTAEDLFTLRQSAGWGAISAEQLKRGLDGSLFSVAAVSNGKTVGAGRLVGDGALVCHIQDVIVLPEFQGRGIGTKIVGRLIEYAKQSTGEGESIAVGLFSAKGREGFYERFGFYIRPNERRGAGMEMIVRGK